MMRFVPLSQALRDIAADPGGQRELQALDRAYNRLSGMPDTDRQGYIDSNGIRKWSRLKNRLTTLFGKKCWYSEARLVGAPLTIDHYRPKIHYWWLAFNPDNYRVACPLVNSPGGEGGKARHFPLLTPGIPAQAPGSIDQGDPVLLDPCRSDDVALLAFQSDGRPVLHPAHASDPIAQHRVAESKILLNLDHPDFNAERAELYHTIQREVAAIEALPIGSVPRQQMQEHLESRMKPDAPYSTAACFYLMPHRHLPWVQEMINRNTL